MVQSVISANSASEIDCIKSTNHMPNSKVNEPEKAVGNHDEYVSSEEKEPIGLYGVSSGEDGIPRVSYDKPEDDPDKFCSTPEAETVTANIDKIDREINSLHDKEQILRQKLRSADENTADDIKRQLEQISAELAQKDNDQYRRQNAVFN